VADLNNNKRRGGHAMIEHRSGDFTADKHCAGTGRHHQQQVIPINNNERAIVFGFPVSTQFVVLVVLINEKM
jgi:hypothetical protein